MEEVITKVDLNNLDKSTWESFKFEEIAFKISESVDPNKTDLEVYIGLEHIDAEDIHIRRTGTPDDVNGQKLKCYPDDVIFGKRRAYQRKAAIVEVEGICSAHAFVLRANKENIDPKLFPFFLHSDQFMHRMIDISVGGLSPTINWGDLKHQEFLLPPREEQSEIAKLLLAMDNVIEKEKKILTKTEIVQHSLFKKFKNKENDWKQYKLSELLNLNYGNALKESDRVAGDFSVVTSAGIQGNHNKYISDGPGIVIGRKGNAGQVTWVENNFWATDTTYYVTLKKVFTELPIKFFYYLLVLLDLKKLSISTAVPGLNRDDALITKVYLPKYDEVEIYLKKFDFLDQQLSIVKSKIDTSKSLQKSLINQVF